MKDRPIGIGIQRRYEDRDRRMGFLVDEYEQHLHKIRAQVMLWDWSVSHATMNSVLAAGEVGADGIERPVESVTNRVSRRMVFLRASLGNYLSLGSWMRNNYDILPPMCDLLSATYVFKSPDHLDAKSSDTTPLTTKHPVSFKICFFSRLRSKRSL